MQKKLLVILVTFILLATVIPLYSNDPVSSVSGSSEDLPEAEDAADTGATSDSDTYHSDPIDGVVWYFSMNADGSATITGSDNSRLPEWHGIYERATGFPEILKIPEKVTFEGSEYIVTVVGASAFESGSLSQYETNLKTIIIPYTVTTIEQKAFAKHANLTSIEFTYDDDGNSSLITIGANAFGVINLLTKDYSEKNISQCVVEIPSSVRFIGESAFNMNMVVTISEDSLLEKIGNFAFANSSGSIYITRSVSEIGYGAFGAGTIVNVDSEKYIFVDGELSDIYGNLISYSGTADEYTTSDNIRYIGPYAFSGSSTKKVTFTDNVESLGPNMFYNSDASEVILPEGIKEIPADSFRQSSLESITIPSSVETISDYAFYKSSKLVSVTIEDNTDLTYIGAYAFAECAVLEEITFGSSSDDVEFVTFYGFSFYFSDSLIKIILDPEFRLGYIGECAFSKSNSYGKGIVQFGPTYGSIFFPASVIDIGTGAFSCKDGFDFYSRMYYENAIGISFEEGSKLESIGDYAFTGNYGIITVDLSNCSDLKEIGDYAFSSIGNYRGTDKEWACADEKGDPLPVIINLPEGIESIGNGAFCYMEAAGEIKIDIPSSVEYVGDLAFLNNYTETTCDITFGSDSLLKYFGTTGWSTGKVDLTQCDHLEHIGYSLCELLLPSGKAIEFGTYTNLYGKTEYMYKVKENYPNVIFDDLSSSSIVITAETEIIDLSIFKRSIDSITCDPENPYFLFEDGCLYLRDGDDLVLLKVIDGKDSVTLDDVTKINDYAFCGCSSLEYIFFEEKVILGKQLFSDCDNLKLIMFRQGIESMGSDSLLGLNGSVVICISKDDQYARKLAENGQMAYEHEVDGDRIYLQERSGDVIITYDNITISDGVVSFEAVFSNGHSPYDMSVTIFGSDDQVTFEDGMYYFALDSGYIVLFGKKDRTSGTHYEVTFDANGGTFSDGSTTRVSIIPEGMSILDEEIPELKMAGKTLVWSSTKDFLTEYDFDTPIYGDVTIYAIWSDRDPMVFFEQPVHGEITVKDKDGNNIDVNSPISPQRITISIEIGTGYEFIGYRCVIDGNEIVDYSNVIEIDLDGDVYIEILSRYYSTSTPLNPLVDTGIPTSEDILEAVKAWEIGGEIDTSNMAKWSGHVSVPLIVGDYVYVRAGEGLYMCEADTGYVVRSVLSSSEVDYFHYLHYGNGVIVDVLTGKAYDLDLNQIYCVSSKIDWLFYNEGYFYTQIDGDLCRFISSDENTASNNEMKTYEIISENIGTAYGQYGSSAPLTFLDDFVYILSADGEDRLIIAVNLITGEYKETILSGIRNQYFDDGWITYYDGKLYLTTYSVGLFGSRASSEACTIVSMSIEGLDVFEIEYTRLAVDGNSIYGLTTNFVIFNGRGYICSSGYFLVYDVETMEQIYWERSTGSHGGITVDISYASEDNNWEVYVYQVAYSIRAGVYVHTDNQNKFSAGTPVTADIPSPNNYCSQPIRSDSEGRIIWYTDAGNAFGYTTADKNVYYLFIQEGDTAKWYKATGATAYDAFMSLGAGTIALGDTKDIVSVNGKMGNWNLYVLSGDIYGYEWKKITDLQDTVNDIYHYYVITQGDIPKEGDVWTYFDGGSFGEYVFKDNIGDRGIIGATLIQGNSEMSAILFYDGNEEIGAMFGEPGSPVQKGFPEIFREGFSLSWIDADGNVVNSLPAEMPSGITRYYAVWKESYLTIDLISITEGQDSTDITFSVNASQAMDEGFESYLLIIYNYKGVYYHRYEKIQIVAGETITITENVRSKDLSHVIIHIVESNDDSRKQVSFGYIYYSPERTITLTLDAGDGIIIGKDTFYVLTADDYPELPIPTLTEYTFGGWSLEDGTIISPDSMIASAENFTLYAIWERSYSVTYTGWKAPEEETKVMVEGTEIPGDSQGKGSEDDPVIVKGLKDGEVTIVAGGEYIICIPSGLPGSQYSADVGDLPGSLSIFGVSGTEIRIKGSIDAPGIYRISKTWNWNVSGRGGVTYSSCTVEFTIIVLPVVETVTDNTVSGYTVRGPLEGMSAEGQRFVEWNTSADGTGESYPKGSRVTSDLVLYPIFEKAYTVTYTGWTIPKEGTKVTVEGTAIPGDSKNKGSEDDPVIVKGLKDGEVAIVAGGTYVIGIPSELPGSQKSVNVGGFPGSLSISGVTGIEITLKGSIDTPGIYRISKTWNWEITSRGVIKHYACTVEFTIIVLPVVDPVTDDAGSDYTVRGPLDGMFVDGQEFVEWNTSADGTGESYPEGSTVYSDLVLYPIFKSTEEEGP